MAIHQIPPNVLFEDIENVDEISPVLSRPYGHSKQYPHVATKRSSAPIRAFGSVKSKKKGKGLASKAKDVIKRFTNSPEKSKK
jgi:hypothetical protein